MLSAAIWMAITVLCFPSDMRRILDDVLVPGVCKGAKQGKEVRRHGLCEALRGLRQT